jgi:hypothetical protein
MPINFRVIAGPSHPDEILTEWEVPVDLPANLITYEVEYERIGDEGETVKVLRLSGAENRLAIKVLNDVQYRLRARAIGFSDISDWTESVEVRCGVIVPSPPECARARCVTPHGSDARGSKLQISWSGSKSDGGSTLHGFRVYWQMLHSSAGGSPRSASNSPRAKFELSETSCQMVDKSARDCIIGGLSSNAFYASMLSLSIALAKANTQLR